MCEKVFVQGEEQGAPHAEELFYHWFLQGPDSMKPANRVKWLNEHGIPLRLYLYVRKSPCKQCVRVLNVFAKYHATRFEIMKLGFQHLYKSPQGFENPNAYDGYNDCAAYYMSNLSGLWVVTRFSWEDDKYKAKLDKAAIEYAYGCDYWDWRSVKPQPFTSAITDSTTMEQSNNNNNNLM